MFVLFCFFYMKSKYVELSYLPAVFGVVTIIEFISA